MSLSYPFFAIKGRPLTVDINEKFKNKGDGELVIGIYCDGNNKQWSICLNDNSIVLQDVNDRNIVYKEYLKVVEEESVDCDGKLIDDTIFIKCFYEEHYNYKIINLVTDKITTSRNYGKAFPISNQVIVEWSIIRLPSKEPGKMVELVKVDAFNFVTGVGQFVCAFSPLPNELLVQISTSIDYTKLFVLSRLGTEYHYHFSVREIDPVAKDADDIIQVWNFGNRIHSCTIKEPHVIIHTDIDILIYNIQEDSSWFIEFEQPVEKGFVTSFKNVLIHWNKHMISGESFLFLNFFDIVSGDSIKSIKVDQKYSKIVPPISISPIGNDQQDNYSKLLILHRDKEIHQLDFTSQHPTI